jgi:ATP-dependent DNA ligase
MIELIKNRLVDKETGEIVSNNVYPKFSGWKYDNYVKDYSNGKQVRFLTPMTCYEADKDNIQEEGTVAEQKFDGHRALCYITERGNRFFSRRVSKKTNWYSENTDQVPHLRDYNISEDLHGTVLDGELTMPTKVFADVQGVTGALPETALQNQLEKGFAIFNAFDILYYKGIKVENMPLWRRKLLLHKVLNEIGFEYFREVKMYAITKKGMDREFAKLVNIVPSFKSLLLEFWEQGLEGLIIKNIDGVYEQKRSKLFKKLKECKTYDVVIIGFEEPTKFYDGKTLDEKGYWDYWVDVDDPDCPICKRLTKKQAIGDNNYAPVTKPFAMGWIGAIDVGVYKDGELVKVAEVKGITDADQEYILRMGGLDSHNKLMYSVIEIKGQGIIDKKTGSIRHPRFSRWRDDKNEEECTWENHLIVG